MYFHAKRRFAWLLWLLPTLLGCSAPDENGNEEASAPPSALAAAVGSAQAGAPCTARGATDDPGCGGDGHPPGAPPAACATPIPILEEGRPAGEVCEAAAAARGLTVIDLSDSWAPRVFAGDRAQGPSPYRATYVALAGEQYGQDPSWERARRDRHFELYGIWPAFSRIGQRLADRERHACHAALSTDGLAGLAAPVDTWRPRDKQRGDRLEARRLERSLGAVAAARGVSIDELASDPARASEVGVFRRLRGNEKAIRELQERLRCEQMLGSTAEAGILDGATIAGMEAWFRRHMVVSWQLDLEVRDLLLTGTRELDLRQALRALRARVIDATGLIEDGSAAGVRGTVIGRTLDTGVFARSPDDLPVNGTAPDLVSRATDQAARALGWTSADDVEVRIKEGLHARVALRLPPPPAHHAAHMDLLAVIDRGDVDFDDPTTRARALPEAGRRELPSLTLVARHAGAEIALLRFPTTIGGWQPEIARGSRRVMLAYKESPAGPRVWRDLVAGPSWIPPDSTPARDLVRPDLQGGWSPRIESFGPHYASAFGLVMLVHHQLQTPSGQSPSDPSTSGELLDGGIRTHGSASYASIFEGTSHGCHRLHNHRAIELAGFLLAHRTHAVRGPMTLDHTRTFTYRDQSTRIVFPSRGFRYELDPPVAVEVRPGRIVSARSTPPPPVPIPAHLARRYAFD